MSFFSPLLLVLIRAKLILLKSFALLWLTGFTFMSLSISVSNASEYLLPVNDGPYIFIKEGELTATWLCQDKIHVKHVKQEDLPDKFPTCDVAVKVSSLAVPADAIDYQGDFKVAAISDFHGQYELVMTLLTNNHIIDNKGDWAFGNGHFVITGDVFDRGDKVTELLWFLYELEQQAALAGGKVHLLLGNHEVMVLNGDLRYLHPKYVKVAELLDTPFEQLFSKNSILGNWLRSKSVLVRVNDMLFAHGGFHPYLAKNARSLEDINKVFKENLVKAELEQPRHGWGNELLGGNGPIWYRGYFKGHGNNSQKDSNKDQGASSAEIDLLLQHFDIKHLVVGHTSQQAVESRYQGRVIAIDSNIKDGEYGEILLIDGQQKWRGTLAGEQVILKGE